MNVSRKAPASRRDGDRTPSASRKQPPPSSRPALKKLPSSQTIIEVLRVQNEALREAQHQVERSRDRYANLFDFAPVAYLALDPKAIVRDVNLTAAAFLGLSRDAIVGFPFVTLVHHEHVSRLWDHMARCRRGALDLGTDLDLRTRLRPRTPVRLLSSPNRHPELEGEYLTAVVDLSEHQLAEQRRVDLERASTRREVAENENRSKDDFFAIVAHELRTPLNAIHGWAHLLHEGSLSEDDTRHGIEVIERNVQIQVKLIEQMLDTAQIVRGSLELQNQLVDFVRLIETAVEGIRPVAMEKRIVIDTELNPLAHLTGDQQRLEQVVSNLLVNAIKFTPEEGRVRVKLERGLWGPSADPKGRTSPDCARLVVSDTGIGIAAEDLSRVFDRFWKGHAPKGEKRGLGLGLAIAQRLVELHSGQIHVRSDGPGRGSTFVVELPVEWDLAPLRTSEPKAAAEATIRLQDVRVLVADDDREARELVKRMLEPLGATVIITSSAREALEALRRLKPDILVSDLAMPEEDGISLMRKVRSLPPEEGGQTPAIALTAYAGAGDEDRLKSVGFETFVAKPVDGLWLGRLIGRVVAHHRSTLAAT